MATIEKSGFMGNVARSIEISKMAEIAKETADAPRLIVKRDGVSVYKVSVALAVDTKFPTKAGNETTTLVVIPLDGGKEFPIDGGKVKMDGIAPFIYGGRGSSHVFSVLTDAGDVMKKSTTRKSAQKEIDALNAKMDTIMAALAALSKK